MMVRLTVRLVGDPAQYDAWMLSETKKGQAAPFKHQQQHFPSPRERVTRLSSLASLADDDTHFLSPHLAVLVQLMESKNNHHTRPSRAGVCRITAASSRGGGAHSSAPGLLSDGKST